MEERDNNTVAAYQQLMVLAPVSGASDGIVGCTFLPTTFLEIAVNVLIFAQKNAEILFYFFFSL